MSKPAPVKQTNLDFTEARDDGVAVASAGPYANHLHLAPDRQPHLYNLPLVKILLDKNWFYYISRES